MDETLKWSAVITGLLTIGPRFGGAIDDAARYFKDAFDRVSQFGFSFPLWHPHVFYMD
jgi:citrate synthase